MISILHGEGFEARINRGVIWARLWWQIAEDHPPFARALLQVLAQHLPAGRCTSLILDLREAPPVAHFGARLRLGAILAAAEETSTPVSVLVGPTEMQARDVHRLVRDRAPSLGRVVAASILDELPAAPAANSGTFRALAA